MKKFCFNLLIFLLLVSAGCGKEKEKKLTTLQKTAQEHYTNGRRLFLTCDPDNYLEALKEFQLAINYWDEYPEALAGYAEAYSMWRGFQITEEEFGKAYTQAQRALRLNPDLSEGYRAMADLFRHRNENEKALNMIQKAIQKDPNSAENYYVQGSILLSQDPKQAQIVLINALSLNPNLAKTYFNLASAEQQLGNLENAEKYLKKYIEMVPRDVSGYCSLGMVYIQKNQLDLAQQQLKRVVAMAQVEKKPWQTPWVYLALERLGRISYQDKNYTQALDYLERARKLSEKEPELFYFIALSQKQIGKLSEAKENFKKAIELNPQEELKKEIKKELDSL